MARQEVIKHEANKGYTGHRPTDIKSDNEVDYDN